MTANSLARHCACICLVAACFIISRVQQQKEKDAGLMKCRTQAVMMEELGCHSRCKGNKYKHNKKESWLRSQVYTGPMCFCSRVCGLE